MSVEIGLLGPVRIRVEGEELPVLESRKALDLLAYLMVNRHRAHHREVLAESLWPDCEPTRARRYLRQCLWQLGSHLAEANAVLGCPIIEPHDSDWISVADKPGLEVDTAFLEEIALGLGGGMVSESQLHRACEAYHGPFLEGRTDRWVGLERERYEALFFRAVNQLMACYATRHELAEACEMGHRCLRFDLAHEPTHRLLMQLQSDAGDRISAIRQYRACERALAEELGAEPDAETQALYQQLRREGLAKSGGSSDERTQLADLSSEIERMQRKITELQKRIGS